MASKVYKKGKLSDSRIVESSGSKDSDQTCLQAVNKAAPFGQLPDGAAKSVEVQYTFDYNIISKR